MSIKPEMLRGESKEKCIYCRRPLSLPFGAEHPLCGLRHPHLSLAGWSVFFLGYLSTDARKVEEEIKDRVRIMGERRSKMILLQLSRRYSGFRLYLRLTRPGVFKEIYLEKLRKEREKFSWKDLRYVLRKVFSRGGLPFTGGGFAGLIGP